MIIKVLQSFKFALSGLKVTWREEHNFRVEVLFSIIVLILATCFQFSFIEFSLCLIAIIMVLSAEIVNTAIEDLGDMVESNPNPLMEKIKDTMAGFVLVASFGAFVLGCLVFYHHFFI